MTHKEILEQTKSELDRLVSEAKRKLDNLVPPKLEVGKWYWKMSKDYRILFCFQGDVDYHFGFNGAGDWSNSIGQAGNKTAIEATPQEVEDALVKEAERRGFLTRGIFFKSFSDNGKVREVQPFECHDGTFNPIELSLNGSYLYYKEGLKCSPDLCSNPRVFEDGKWATIIEKPAGKFAELKEAHKNGAVIQLKSWVDGEWYDVEDKTDLWLPNYEYRIKPEEEKKTLSIEDIEKKEDKFAELKEAYRNGKDIQMLIGSSWIDVYLPKWGGDFEYRIKPEEKPKVGDVFIVKIKSDKDIDRLLKFESYDRV